MWYGIILFVQSFPTIRLLILQHFLKALCYQKRPYTIISIKDGILQLFFLLLSKPMNNVDIVLNFLQFAVFY